MADEITDAEIAELRRLHEAADRAPWFLVGHPWADDRAADTYAISGSPDPHAGTPVLQWCEVDEVTIGDGDCEASAWRDAEYKQRANLACAVAARNAVPSLLSRLERVERERDEARAVATNDAALSGGFMDQAFADRDAALARIATLEAERDEARRDAETFRAAHASLRGAIIAMRSEFAALIAQLVPGEASNDQAPALRGLEG